MSRTQGTDAERIKTGTEYWLNIARQVMDGTLTHSPDDSRSGQIGVPQACKIVLADPEMLARIKAVPTFEDFVPEYDSEQELLEFFLVNPPIKGQDY